MALAALFDVKYVMEDKMPDASRVQQKLHVLAKSIAGSGPNPRQDIIDADGYQVVINAWKFFCNTGEHNVRVLTPDAELIREASLRVLYRLSVGFPEIADEFSFIMIVQAFYNVIPEPTKILGLKFMRNICIKNEENRQKLALEYHIAESFVHLIKVESPSAELVREWCSAFRTFTLSDDETVVYNRSPERKRLVYLNQAHNYLNTFLNAYDDDLTLNSVVNAISIIASNEDFCVAIESSGGLRGIQRVLENYGLNIPLMQNTILCLRYLYMSPIVREKGGSTPILKMILHLIRAYQEIPVFVEISLSCLAFVTLHNACACAQFLVDKGVHLIIDIMKLHEENLALLKSACLILRNIAAIAGKIGKATIIDSGAEVVLREIGEKHIDLIENHINPVIRDLGFGLMVAPAVTGDEIPSADEHPGSAEAATVPQHKS